MYPIIIIPENYKEFITYESLKIKNDIVNINEKKKSPIIKVAAVILVIIFIFNFIPFFDLLYKYPIYSLLIYGLILIAGVFINVKENISATNNSSESISKIKQHEFIFIRDFSIVESVPIRKIGSVNVENNSFYTIGQSAFYNKGVLEKYFYQYLKKSFGNLVTNSFDLKIKFCPDFILIDELNKIKIAIEIDEPYSFELRKPIHLKNSHEYKHSVYGNNGWFVIRFAEEQIVRYPEKCCEEIINLRKKIIIKANLSELSKTKYSSIIKEEWDESEAKFYEKNKLREKYLTEFGIKY